MKNLNISQKEYLERNRNLEYKVLATSTGLSEKAVKKFLNELPAPEPTKELTEENGQVKIGKYIVQEGSVIMTASQSSFDDDNKKYLESSIVPNNEKHIHKFTLKTKKIVPKN